MWQNHPAVAKKRSGIGPLGTKTRVGNFPPSFPSGSYVERRVIMAAICTTSAGPMTTIRKEKRHRRSQADGVAMRAVMYDGPGGVVVKEFRTPRSSTRPKYSSRSPPPRHGRRSRDVGIVAEVGSAVATVSPGTRRRSGVSAHQHRLRFLPRLRRGRTALCPTAHPEAEWRGPPPMAFAGMGPCWGGGQADRRAPVQSVGQMAAYPAMIPGDRKGDHRRPSPRPSALRS